MTHIDHDITLPSGNTYSVLLTEDREMGYTPWEDCDGHGRIRRVRARYGLGKKPGERVMHKEEGHFVWLYDYAAAVAEARRDGWGSANCTDDMTKGQRAARAALDDMEWCTRWLTGDACYVTVEVYPVDEEGARIKGAPADALCAVAYSTAKADRDYVRSVALEMAKTLDTTATKEADEAAYWAARDVLTVGA
jgi:hypothetical protein